MNYIKTLCIFAGIFVAAAAGNACSNDSASGSKEQEQKCVDSGGQFENELCICNGKLCGENEICGADGACQGKTEPPDLNALEKLCKDSGGTFKDQHCVCNGKICNANVICLEDGNCSDSQEKLCDVGDRKCSEGTAYECTQMAQWAMVESCNNGCAIDGKKCAECLETSCKDGKLTQCNDNVATTVECPNGCNDAGNDCKPECEAGEVKCNDRVRLECNPETHTWNEVETCSVACEMVGTDNTRCIDNCTDGETRCTDGKISTCVNKIWAVPQSCPDNNACADDKRCSECSVTDPANPPRRCVNNPETGVGQIEVCNGSLYEIEMISTDPGDPNSPLKKNICDNGFSCKADAAECGECNISTPTICRNEIAIDDGCAAVGTAGKVYSCDKGRLVLEKECSEEGSSTKVLSCNADGTACGTCRNGNIDKCENDSKSVGHATICRNGDFIVDECERGLPCTNDGRSCKLCVYSNSDASNEKICNTCQEKSTFLLVCDESGKFVRRDCPSQGNMKTYCHLDSSQSYKAYCAQ